MLRLNEGNMTLYYSPLCHLSCSEHHQRWDLFLMLTTISKTHDKGKRSDTFRCKGVEIAGSKKLTVVPDAALQSFLHSPSILNLLNVSLQSPFLFDSQRNQLFHPRQILPFTKMHFFNTIWFLAAASGLATPVRFHRNRHTNLRII